MNRYTFEVKHICNNLWGVFCVEKNECVFETDAEDLAKQLTSALNKLNN